MPRAPWEKSEHEACQGSLGNRERKAILEQTVLKGFKETEGKLDLTVRMGKGVPEGPEVKEGSMA